MKHVTSDVVCGRGRASGRGFTIIELLITVVILVVLLAVALPSYQGSMRKSRRSEAFTALSNILQAQERHRSTNVAFTADVTSAPPTGLGQPATRTASGYYDLSITGNTATAYNAFAVAVAGTSQANDGDCAVLGVQMQGGNIRYGAGSAIASINWADPLRCWAR